MLTVTPFSGFYDTLHSDSLEAAQESRLDDEGEPLAFRGSVKEVNWRRAHTAYARLYTRYLKDEINIPSLQFEEITFPKEYNFEKETLYCEVSLADAQRLLDGAPNLPALAKEVFTSRDGFFSFYSPDTTTWGTVDTWDCNQLGCLFQAWLNHNHPSSESGGERFCQWAEYEVMESARCNGLIDDIIQSALPPEFI